MAAAVANAQALWRGIVLQRVCGDRFLADDLLQRFAMRAMERLDDVREPERIYGWLRVVLASTLADHARETARRVEYAVEPSKLAAFPAPIERDADEPCPCLHPNLKKLRADQTEILHQVDLAGERREVVARALGLRLNALDVRLHRARRALAKVMETSCRSCRKDGFVNCACRSP